MTPPHNAPGREVVLVWPNPGVGRPHVALPQPHPLLASSQMGPQLLCQVSPPCKWMTPEAIFCVILWCLHRVFFLFHSCSSEIMKSPKKLWNYVSDTNIQVKCIVFIYY